MYQASKKIESPKEEDLPMDPPRRPSAEQRAEIEQQLLTRGLLQDVSESELIELRRGTHPKHSPEDLNKEAREALEKNGPWLVARTKPHREYEAKQALKAAGFEVYLPKLKLIIGRKRRKTLGLSKRRKRKRRDYLYLFPKYLFVRLTENWKTVLKCKWISVIIRCPGPLSGPEHEAKPVNGTIILAVFMKKGSREMKNRERDAEPVTMKDREIKKWKAREQGGFICLEGYKRGQKVRAKAGPLANQIGEFIELVGEDREFASFYILGQETRVEFSPDVLEAVV